MSDAEVVTFTVSRKVWKPSVNSKTLVVSIPPVPFLALGDRVTVKVTSRLRLIVEKEAAAKNDCGRHNLKDADHSGSPDNHLPNLH